MSVHPVVEPGRLAAAPDFTFGDAPHADADARTPGRANWDVAVHKTIGLARARLTLRADVINLFDDPGFFGPLISSVPATSGSCGGAGTSRGPCSSRHGPAGS
jgi:hypothetical protein